MTETLTAADIVALCLPDPISPELYTRILNTYRALSGAQRDSKRLDWLADEPIFDGLGKLDIHEVACDIAGGAEVSPERMRECYRKAIRVLIDRAAAEDDT